MIKTGKPEDQKIKNEIQRLQKSKKKVKEITKILKISNKTYYRIMKDKSLKTVKEKIQTIKPQATAEKQETLNDIHISGNPAINDFLRQQELCLEKLIKTAKEPFKNEWEYMRWHREALALELSQTHSNDNFLDNRALWENLIEGNAEEDKREWVITILHNFLEIIFSQARTEMTIREAKEGII